MRKSIFLGLALLCLSPFRTAYALTITPTTTVAIETGNNTSVPDGFKGESNGALPASNISKVPTRTLLYPGSHTALYAHDEPWWGSASHINIGYSSQDPNEVHKQVQDMISRGINGVLPDWYGPDSYEETGCKLLKNEAEANSPFKLIIEIEHGAVLWDSCYKAKTCTVTQAVINLANQVSAEYFSSPAYAKSGGRPILFEFAMEVLPDQVDWAQVQASVTGNPIWIHRDASGYTKVDSTGAFSWVSPKSGSPDPTYDDASYLRGFYSASLSHKNEHTFGSAYKGFDDSLASWGANRHIVQKCGQTWLNTFATANKYFSASTPLEAMQLVTWNDYEEGTEMETGIDNCLSITTSMSGSKLSWTVTGSTTTLDHYTLFVSTDNFDLMVLQDNISPATLSLDVSALGLPNGSYLSVKAVGKPSILNHLSNSVTYTASNANARYMSQNVPATMAPGQTYPISITMQNNGGLPWTNSGSNPYGLGSENPQDNLTWGLSRVHVPSTVTVSAGQSYTFSFNVVAPSTPSVYNFQWRMLQEHVQWFGDGTANVAITVQSLTNPVPVLSSMTPTSVVVNSSSFTLMAYGNNFVPGSIVRWGGAKRPTIWINASELDAAIPASDLSSTGTVSITVLNPTPGGGPSKVSKFMILSAQPNAKFVSQNVVRTMKSGQTYNAQLTIMNTGNSPWNNTNFGLGSENPQDNQTWKLGRVYLNEGEVIMPAEQKIFTFQVVAPSTPGAYNFQWRMLEEHVQWFGDMTPDISITVNGPVPESLTSVTTSELSGVQVYPNPWRSDRHTGKLITFANLALNSALKIFSVSGHLVKTLPDSSSSVSWDLTNESGEKVGSGLYIYLIKTDMGQKKTGTIAIVR